MHRPKLLFWFASVPLALSCSGDEAAGPCHWQDASRLDFKHFSFLLTTPDGQAQSPPTTYVVTSADAAWPIRDFEGVIADQSGNQFTVDTCLSADSCQPSRYRFVLCDSLPCVGAASPAPIELALPVGHRIRVVWRMENPAPGYCPGLYWLAIYDAELGATQGDLLFLGSGGYDPGPDPLGATPFSDLPFSVATQPLLCGKRDPGWSMGDDYAIIFSQADGAGSLQLGTGESGAFHFVWPAGSAQTLQIHCLVAVQPDHTDDYWNWDFWAASPRPAYRE